MNWIPRGNTFKLIDLAKEVIRGKETNQSCCNGCQKPTVIRGEYKFWWCCSEPICVRSVPKFQECSSLWVFAGLCGCRINKTNTVACSHDGNDAAAAARSAMKSALGCKIPPFTSKDVSNTTKWMDSCISVTTNAARQIRGLTKSSLDWKCDGSGCWSFIAPSLPSYLIYVKPGSN